MISKDGIQAFLVDGVTGVAVHNGVARIQFMRLDIQGRPEEICEVHIPVNVVRGVVEALRKISPA